MVKRKTKQEIHEDGVRKVCRAYKKKGYNIEIDTKRNPGLNKDCTKKKIKGKGLKKIYPILTPEESLRRIEFLKTHGYEIKKVKRGKTYWIMKRKLAGNGLASRAFQVSANVYRKLRCGNKSRQLYDGEYHPLCSNYCGPGTRVDLPEVRNFPPYNEVDNVCRNHDLDYNEADKLQGEERYKKFREADEKMLRDLEQFKNIEPYYSIAKKAISLKVKGEDWIPFLSKLINPYHGKK